MFNNKDTRNLRWKPLPPKNKTKSCDLQQLSDPNPSACFLPPSHWAAGWIFDEQICLHITESTGGLTNDKLHC